jgi:hypothetical protein
MTEPNERDDLEERRAIEREQAALCAYKSGDYAPWLAEFALPALESLLDAAMKDLDAAVEEFAQAVALPRCTATTLTEREGYWRANHSSRDAIACSMHADHQVGCRLRAYVRLDDLDTVRQAMANQAQCDKTAQAVRVRRHTIVAAVEKIVDALTLLGATVQDDGQIVMPGGRETVLQLPARIIGGDGAEVGHE